MERYRDAVLSRGHFLTAALDIPEAPADSTVEGFIDFLLGHSELPSQSRTVVLLAALTGRYPTEAQVLDLQPWVAVGSSEHVYRLLRRAVQKTPRRALARLPVAAPSTVVDMTRTARAVTLSGIPRVARAVASAAVEHGGAAISWADGVPGVVRFDHAGTPVFVRPARRVDSRIGRIALGLKRTYWRLLNAVSQSDTGYRFASIARGIVSPLGARLFNRFGPAEMLILADCHYVLPEVTMTDTGSRLMPWLGAGPDLHLTIGVHDLLPINSPRFFHPSQRLEHIEFARLVANADEIVVASPHLQDEIDGLRAVFGVGQHARTRVIPFGGGTGAVGTDRRLLVDRNQFLMIGSLETRKNHALVLRALGMLARSGHTSTLHLVGAHRPPSPDTRAALHYARRCGVQVLHYGAASDAVVLAVADRCAALFYPSFNEGYGLPILEALSIGLPVIASDIPSSRAHSHLGGLMLMPTDDPTALADAVLALMKDDDQYAQLVTSIDIEKIPVGFSDWIDALLHNGDATITM